MNIELQKITYEEKDEIAYLWLNSPPGNVMTPIFLQELVEVIEKYVLKTTKKGVIITGKGRHFSSGADVEQLIEYMKSNMEVDTDGLQCPEWYKKCRENIKKLNEMTIPVIAAIQGYCIGSGFELALAAHARIAEENAQLGLVEAEFGLLPGVRGTIRMSQIIGYHKALELILGAEIMSADMMLNYRLVDCVCVRKKSIELAEQFIKKRMSLCNDYVSSECSNYLVNYMKGNKVCL